MVYHEKYFMDANEVFIESVVPSSLTLSFSSTLVSSESRVHLPRPAYHFVRDDIHDFS